MIPVESTLMVIGTPWKDRIRRGKDALQSLWSQGIVGRNLLLEHSRMMDAFIQDVFAACKLPAAREMAMVALGGYGRRELFPFSDIDILLLYSPEEEKDLEGVAERLFYPLWDAGLEVGHGVRTIDDCMESAARDFFFQVAMLDARFLCGKKALFDELAEAFSRRFIQGNRKGFVIQVLDHRRERHRRFGSHVYLLEPNIKESRGGLRDLQSMLWISKVLFGLQGLEAMEDAGLLSREERTGLEAAWDALVQLRNRLHFISGRKNDRLYFEYQEELSRPGPGSSASRSGTVPAFMQQVHEHLNTIAIASDLFFEHIDEVLHLSPRGEDRPLEDGIEIIGGKIQLTRPEILNRRPYYLMKVFQHAAREGLPIHYRTRRLVRANLHLVDGRTRTSIRMSRSFLDIFNAPANPLPVLEAMLDTGLLAAYIPEFKRVKSLVQHDVYHTYTVDRHLLQTVSELFLLKQEEKAVFRTLKRPCILFLAGLLHDIGKGDGHGHARRGSDMVEGIAKRLGLGREEVETLSFLVARHLFLVDTAMRRDLEDEALIIKCAREIMDLERLDMLYLLSIADAKATGPTVWNDWKAALLLELYLKIAHLIERSDLVDPDRMQAVSWMKDQVKRLLGAGAQGLVDIMPEDYLLSFTPEAISRHLELRKRLEKEPIVLVPQDRRHYWSLLLVARDRPGLLARVFGVLALHDLEVLAAQIFTLKDGTAVDVLEVRPAVGRGYDEQDWDAVHKDMGLALGDRLALSYRLASKLRPIGQVSLQSSGQPEAEVVLDNDCSDFYTVIEIYAENRRGLLYDITKTLSDFGVDIFRAKIGTRADQVVDVFYVLDRWGQKLTEPQLQRELKNALRYAASCPVGKA